MKNMISVDDAYKAMFIFLERYWARGGKNSEDIAILLSDMQYTGSFTADPAAMEDWLLAVNESVDIKKSQS